MSYLDHEFADYAVEDGVVVIPVFRMRNKVLDRFWRRFGEQSDVDVAIRGVQNRSGTRLCRFGFKLLLGVEIPRLFVLHVPRGFADVLLVGEDVEADFSGSGRDEHWVSFLGFLKQRVCAGGHGNCNDSLLLRLALVEGEIEGSKGLVFAKYFHHSIGKGVDNFGS